MTKSETLNALAEKTGKTRKEAGELSIKIPAKTVLKFRVAKAAKEAIL
ncbi:MAG: hypothetical protein UY65_C0028G0007 [Parcubacteria group bacterium GW2011_GWA2_51_12]|nr:MAG: hypothetical protein UY65_C0028G0007 [Parcubacteria group bacterium GW2011_GWA2_51_12]